MKNLRHCHNTVNISALL